jgi:hypothetical protein
VLGGGVLLGVLALAVLLVNFMLGSRRLSVKLEATQNLLVASQSENTRLRAAAAELKDLNERLQSERDGLAEKLRILNDAFSAAFTNENVNSASSGLDRFVNWLVGLGVPGLVLTVAISVSGFAGAAAITSALAALGGPLGMLGGIGVLGLFVPISRALSKHGLESIFARTIRGLQEKGMSREDIATKIESYPISRELKVKLQKLVYA